MPVIEEISSIERTLRRRKIKLGDLLSEAGIKGSTWHRWRNGAEPLKVNWDSVITALDKLKRENKTRQG